MHNLSCTTSLDIILIIPGPNERTSSIWVDFAISIARESRRFFFLTVTTHGRMLYTFDWVIYVDGLTIVPPITRSIRLYLFQDSTLELTFNAEISVSSVHSDRFTDQVVTGTINLVDHWGNDARASPNNDPIITSSWCDGNEDWSLPTILTMYTL